MAVDERNNCKFLDNWRLTPLLAFIGARLLRNSSKFDQNITHRQTDETCHKPSPTTTATVINCHILVQRPRYVKGKGEGKGRILIQRYTYTVNQNSALYNLGSGS